MSDVIHYSNWSSQPNIFLACGIWTTPDVSVKPPAISDEQLAVFNLQHATNIIQRLMRYHSGTDIRARIDKTTAETAIFRFNSFLREMTAKLPKDHDVYTDMEGRRYTFNREHATCPACLTDSTVNG